MFFSVFSKQSLSTVTPPLNNRNGDLLRFDADRLVAGIRFHLLEDGVAEQVDPESERVLAETLPPDLSASISRDRWELMRNLDRLQFLLHHAGVVVTITPEGTAMLRERRSWLSMLPML